MKTSFSWVLLFLSIALLPVAGFTQGLGEANATVTTNPYAQVQTVWLVAGKVSNVHGEVVKGAQVTVAPIIAAQVRSLSSDGHGQFRTEYQLNAAGVDEFSIVLTVRKKGYQTAHAYLTYAHSAKTFEVPVTLREPDEDPALLSTEDLVSGLLPKLRGLTPADGLSAKSAKDYARGVTEFFDQHRPERAMPAFAKVLQRDPACIGCRTTLGVAELAWNDLDDGSRTLAESVNAVLADRKNGRPEPLVAYGTWLNWQHEPDKAEPYFVEALKYTPQDPLALQELGRSLLAEQKYDYATEYLNKALAAGAGPEARLLYVQALVGAGRPDDALTEMNRYLDGRDVQKLPIHIRQVWASVQNREKVKATYAKAKTTKGQEHVDFLKHPPANLIQGLEPAKDQAELNPILDGVGAKIQELLKNFPNTSSLEAIHQEKLGRKGEVSDKQSQKFRYLCVVPRETWGPGFLEYRADFDGNAAMPKGLSDGYMLTQGFNSTALFFHPSYRDESTFQYLGRQNINGRSTYVLAFAQIPGKAHLTGNFRKGQTSYTTLSQGLAWVDADSYQIVRIHTELLAPLPDLRLEKQTMDVDFHEVHFARLNQSVWLPEDVLVSLDWNGKLLRNRHEYSDYKVFDVDASEKIGQPKGAEASSKQSPSTTDAP
jgi:tetratricopeptide (TPR) repeat protein